MEKFHILLYMGGKEEKVMTLTFINFTLGGIWVLVGLSDGSSEWWVGTLTRLCFLAEMVEQRRPSHMSRGRGRRHVTRAEATRLRLRDMWYPRPAWHKSLNFAPFATPLLAVGGGGLFGDSWWSSVWGGGGVRVVWYTVIVGALAFVVAGWGNGSFVLFRGGSCSLTLGNSLS